MKKILGFVILFGFVLMLGAAGSADACHISFVTLLLLEFAGALTVLLGTSALMHYKRYVRRLMRMKAGKRPVKMTGTNFSSRISVVEKELC